jgi:hypothetical protein
LNGPLLGKSQIAKYVTERAVSRAKPLVKPMCVDGVKKLKNVVNPTKRAATRPAMAEDAISWLPIPFIKKRYVMPSKYFESWYHV